MRNQCVRVNIPIVHNRSFKVRTEKQAREKDYHWNRCE